MMPLLPLTSVAELGREHLGGHARAHRAARAIDPDGILSADALPPDPVYMAIRRLMTIGPIGAARARIERWTESREDRRNGQTIDYVLHLGSASRLPDVRAESVSADDAERIIAA